MIACSDRTSPVIASPTSARAIGRGPNAGLCGVGIEYAKGVTIQRLQRRDAREFDGTAMLGRGRQHLGRREDGRQASLCGGDSFDQMRDGLTEGR
jgi:hypothetical protein